MGNLDSRIKLIQEDLERKLRSANCIQTSTIGLQWKRQVLEQSTHEMCKYMHFLDYLQETQVDDLQNLITNDALMQEFEPQINRNLAE